MKVHIRFLTANAAGVSEYNDKIIETEIITIGRATDRTLHLKDRRVRLQHAEIKLQNGELSISTSTLAGVTVNGNTQRETRLISGDVIEIGANVLRVLEPDAGIDLAISFELSESAKTEDMAPDWTSTPQDIGGFSKRRMAWTAVAVVAIAALLLPGLSLLHPTVASVMRGSQLLPDDSLWLAGPVHSAHSTTSTECQNCHTNLFSRVPDTACVACHSVEKHVTASSHPVIGSERCASCHLEHNEPAQLVKRHQSLCADCHADLPDDVPLAAVGNFLNQHASFNVTLLVPSRDVDGSTLWTTERMRLAEAKSANRSNLKFDHQIHVDEAGILSPEGRRQIDCVTCHQPEAGGARMQAISMDKHCSGCHTLSFDADDPTRTVPHGDPAGVVQALVEYYSARLLGEDSAAVEQRLRRPGQELSRTDRDRAAAEARVQALSVAEDLFERRACVNCHEVSRTDDDSMPWRVEPVRLTQTFLPKANFNHAAHDTEVTSCDSCHGASVSSSATDVLIPDIESCRECHGSGIARHNASSQTPSTCIMCHSFHFDTADQQP